MKKLFAIISSLFLSVSAFVTSSKLETKVNAESEVTSPIVWYNFEDSNNYGKDAIGNQDLIIYGDASTITRGDKGIKFGNHSMYANSIKDGKDFSDYWTDLTISLYFKPTDKAGTSRILCTGNYSELNGFCLFYVKNSDGSYSIIPDTHTENGLNGVEGGHFRFVTPITAINEWNHFVVSIDSTNQKIMYFLNNQCIGTVENCGKILLSNAWQTFSLFGVTHTAGGGSTEFYNGYLDDVRIYDFAMNETQANSITQGQLNSLSFEKETIVSASIDNSDVAINSLLTGEFIYLQLPQKVSLTGSKGKQEEADILWYSSKKNGNQGTAYGYIYNTSLINAKGFVIKKDFYISNDAELPLIMSAAFTDNLVLQRNGCRVFGKAGNTTVTVTLEGYPGVSTTCTNGEWEVELNLPAIATSKKLTITTTKKEKVEINNVLVGEVWYASGQSNMDWMVNQTKADTMNSLKNADYTNLRIMKRSMLSSFEPIDVFSDKWIAPTNVDEAGRMSAIATCYGLELKKQLKEKEGIDVPVGMISAAVGGSGIEQWLSKETIQEVGSRIDTAAGKYDTQYYYGMNYSVRNYSITGVLWYQGEDNVYYPTMYKKQLKGYVKDMKNLFKNEDLTFIVYQLPQWEMSEWAEFRQCQWEVSQEIENLYVCTGIDLGEYHDIHPTKDKYVFSTRAAGIAMKYVYGDTNASGLSPFPSKIYAYENKVEINLNDGAGIKAMYKGKIDGFEVLVNGKWIEAKAEILNGKISLSNFAGTPTMVRYFHLANVERYEDSGGFNFIYNGKNLPLAPFILNVNTKTYNVNIESSHGEISTNTINEVEEGQTLTIRITPDEGYEVQNVLQDGKEIYCEGNTVTTSMIMKDTNIVINYKQKETISYLNVALTNDSTKGKVILSKEQIQKGESVSALIIPSDGYEVDKVLVNGNKIKVSDNTIVLNDVNIDLNITVNYKKITANQEDTKKGCSGSASGLCLSIIGCLAVLLKKKPIK